MAQEMTCWLLEPAGSDPMYPAFGSKLWDMVGSPMTRETLAKIKAEVRRVVENYVTYQRRQVSDDRSSTASARLFDQKWGAGEVIESIDSIVVTSNLTSANVKISFTTTTGQSGVVEQTL